MDETNQILEDKITNVEIKLAYLEDFLNQLQEVTVEQSKEIELLKHENKSLNDKLKDVFENMSGDIPNRKPPHW